MDPISLVKAVSLEDADWLATNASLVADADTLAGTLSLETATSLFTSVLEVDT